MKKKLLSAVVLCALGFVGCGGDDDENPPPAIPKFDTPDNIRNYLEGKKLLMEGTNIPSHPNGLSEDVNYGDSTQCYQKVEMTVASNNFTVNSTKGTLRDGACDHDAVSGTASFTSTAVLIDNANAEATCFDITVSYNGFAQSGRGNLAADGKKLTLELFFGTADTGARCAHGAVGSPTVTLASQPFTGNAQQIYVVSAQ